MDSTFGNFVRRDTDIGGAYVIEPRVFPDARGYFLETFRENLFQEMGLPAFVQDNQSASVKGVLRGLHFQKHFPQGKLVRVAQGEIYDVIVDVRRGSASFGRALGFSLSEVNQRMLYVPPGLAHGFLVRSERVVFLYRCTDYYHPDDEGGIIWNDPAVKIDWPLEGLGAPLLSEKDQVLPLLAEAALPEAR